MIQFNISIFGWFFELKKPIQNKKNWTEPIYFFPIQFYPPLNSNTFYIEVSMIVDIIILYLSININ